MKAVIFVAALGYFVDVFDLILFSVLRVTSLKSLGVEGADLLTQGAHLFNMQMTGMLIGGIFWGVIGDRKGRISVLFGSILMYSIANIMNARVETVEAYAFWRFIAGIGLAGELGAGITLVCELMPKEKRGYGTTIVATVGVLGAVTASVTGSLLDWRTNYYLGGFLGLALLLLRVAVSESGLFNTIKSKDVARGSLFMLFSTKERAWRYILCIMCGVPIWGALGIIMTFSPEIAASLGVKDPVVSASTVFYTYVGLTFGDLSSGLLSQYFKSRKKVIYIYLTLTAIFSLLIVTAKGWTAQGFILLFLPLGFSVGYWAMLVTVAAEQFGTNLRATVATSVPNFVRGAAVPATSLFLWLIPHSNPATSALIVLSICLFFAYIAVYQLSESFHKDMDFIES